LEKKWKPLGIFEDEEGVWRAIRMHQLSEYVDLLPEAGRSIDYRTRPGKIPKPFLNGVIDRPVSFVVDSIAANIPYIPEPKPIRLYS